MKTIYLAGGCFWGTEHFIRQFDGINETITGYANGIIPNPTYKQVYTDKTGHVECVKVNYDEDILTLYTLLKLFFISIDPIQKDGQAGDIGKRYRTGIYWTDDQDREIIEKVHAEIQASYGENVLAVEIGELQCFYPAEDYHQDYLLKHPDGYCHITFATLHFARTFARLTKVLKAMDITPKGHSKADRYSILFEHISPIVKTEDNITKRMAQISLMIHQCFNFWWTGFYIVTDNELILGPYQGPLACLRIAFGRGVCGTAWKEKRTIIVPDVEEFPGHIACSSESKSEIVVPIWQDGEIKAVLDIDSEKHATFDNTDAHWLEKITSYILHSWQQDASGAAAALAVHEKTTPADVSLDELKVLLESHGAILR